MRGLELLSSKTKDLAFDRNNKKLSCKKREEKKCYVSIGTWSKDLIFASFTEGAVFLHSPYIGLWLRQLGNIFGSVLL